MKFCVELDLQPVPASQRQMELYIAYLSESLKYASIPKYLNIIRLLHVEAGLPNPLQDNVWIKALLRGVKRELGNATTQKLHFDLPMGGHVIMFIFCTPLLNFD